MHDGDDLKAQTEQGGQREPDKRIKVESGEGDLGKRSGDRSGNLGDLSKVPGSKVPGEDPGSDPGSDPGGEPGQPGNDSGRSGGDVKNGDVGGRGDDHSGNSDSNSGDEHGGDQGSDPGPKQGKPGGDTGKQRPESADDGTAAGAGGLVEVGPSNGTASGAQLFRSAAGSPEERVQEERLNRGEGTPAEALTWFQTHGMPGLTKPPAWNPILNAWIFPDPAAHGGSIIAELPAVPQEVAGSGAGSGSGSGSDNPTGPGAAVDSFHWGSPGADDIGSVANGTGASVVDGSGLNDGPGPSRQGSGGAATVGPDDGVHVFHAESTFARDTVAAGVRDMLDKNNPLLARYVLAELLPAAFIGELVEKYFVNPLLGAPANILEAAEVGSRALDKFNAGDYPGAVSDAQSADAKLKEAALAIVMVIPIGGAAGKAAQGVEYLGPRLIPTVERWAVEQAWVTGTSMEHVFRVEEYVVQVDGFINKTGVPYVTKMSDMVLVEAKMASRIRLALEGTGSFAETAKAKLIDQAARYLLLDSHLGTDGVRFVVTEGGQAPLTAKLLELFTQEYPQAVGSGQLKVIFTPPPP